MQESPGEVTFDGKTYTLDAHGFLSPPEQWDEGFANGMAELLEIYGGLKEKHWNFIRYLRNKFLEEKTVPVVVLACADNNLRLSEFKLLFPTGYHRGACKIAGIDYEFMYKTNYWLTYETSAVLGADHKVTAAGFLEDFEKWDEGFAQTLVREWKLRSGLTDKHREVIRFLRDFYADTGTIPSIFEFCKSTDLTFDGLNELFPEGYRRGACRIAGLPFFP
jgi:tRNA 2-thiouridine synthesizing protein E